MDVVTEAGVRLGLTKLAVLLEEVARYGTATVKRAYGDWTTDRLKSWKAELHRHAIQPIQQFQYTTGKNASDSALIIDAMDLLHAGHLDGFCIVSSDSDFTRLATRIREAGLIVYGFGEEKTPGAVPRGVQQVRVRGNPESAARNGQCGEEAHGRDPRSRTSTAHGCRGDRRRRRLGTAFDSGISAAEESILVRRS